MNRASDPRPGRLPRGRHGLSPEEVAAQQRERILLACVEEVARRGYADTPVAAIIKGAGVSRETFYRLFESRADCFLAALDTAAGLLLEVLGATVEEARELARTSPVAGLETLLGTYLESLAAEPSLARVFLVEVYAAGPEAARRRARIQEDFAEALVDVLGLQEPDDVFAAEALVAAVAARLTALLTAGTVPDDELGAAIRALHAPFVRLAARTFGAVGAAPQLR